ncbi:NACHT domain-containing protein [Kribbella monticola]|uniref:NACHT domain-containing protein n=1 Tax=Kribbella monticola TaxID=2185285 RepID=UPI000DD3D0E0
MPEHSDESPKVEISHSQGFIVGDYATQHNTFVRAQRRTRSQQITDTADQLAIAVRRQWRYEATWRQLDDPYALPVSWQAADPALVAGWETIQRIASSGPGWPSGGSESWAAGPEELAGSGPDLLATLTRVPTGRLVVLGEPGSGKTILLLRLILDLLERREPGGPVPVLAPLASWDPEEHDLYGWIERWLCTENTALATKLKHGPPVTLARGLLEAGLIFPLLDGFDEMPTHLLTSALGKMNSALQSGQRLVLACRTDLYSQALSTAGAQKTKLAGAAGVELRPLDPAVIIDYLTESAGGPEADTPWPDIAAAVAADDRGALAQTLTTPLMASLARAIYNPRVDELISEVPRSPAELLDTDVFATRTAVEEHLFDQFIPAAYRPYPDNLKGNRWSAPKAQRWLTFLARDLEHRQGGTTDIAWWHLTGAAPRPTVGLLVGLVAAVAGALTIPWRGWGVGLITTLAIGLVIRGRVKPAKPGLSRALAGGILGGELAAFIAFLVFGAGPGNTYVAAFVAGGVAVGIVSAPMSSFSVGLVSALGGELAIAFYERAGFTDPVRTSIGDGSYLINGVALGLVAGLCANLLNRRAPARGLRWSWRGFAVGAVGGGLFAIVVSLTIHAGAAMIGGALAIVTGGLAGGLYEAATPTDLAKANSPAVVLARDRSTFLVSLALALPLCATIGLNTALSPPDPFNGSRSGAGFGLGVGVALFIGIGCAFAFFQATWGGFMIVRVWLATSGRLPWRLIAFLKDAHTGRGVLRQSGAVYQFRHAELQRRLARH